MSAEVDPSPVQAFREHGYVVTPPMFDAAELHAARVEIEGLWADRNEQIARSGARGAASKAAWSRARPELQRLHFDSAVLAAFVTHPALARLAGALIGPDADMSWNQAYAKVPGGDPRTEIPWHQDAYYAEVEGPTYNCWIAISRATVDNGTIVRAPIPPGDGVLAHAWDERHLFYRCEVDERDALPVELEPGQAFVFTGRVPHRSGVNVSGATRVSYSVSFAAPHTRLRANGEPFGDRVPVLRGGRPIREVMAEHARAPADPVHPGARVLAQLAARAPARAAETHARFQAYAQVADAAEADRQLLRLLAILPDDQEVLGDLVRARARIDQLVREYETVRGTDAHVERLLLQRVLELAPDHAPARAALASLRR